LNPGNGRGLLKRGGRDNEFLYSDGWKQPGLPGRVSIGRGTEIRGSRGEESKPFRRGGGLWEGIKGKTFKRGTREKNTNTQGMLEAFSGGEKQARGRNRDLSKRDE